MILRYPLSTLATALFALAPLSLSGCSGDPASVGSDHSSSTGHKSDPAPGDTGSPSPGTGGAPTGGVQCGKNTCSAGQVCCNESCGICAPRGAACIQIFCGDVPQHCGGFAGTRCPDGQQCVDDPSDSCDPNNGGADCGGICVPGGGTTDPCAAATCPTGTICVAKDGQASCEPAGGRTACGGIAGLPCPDGQQCVDDPSDSCDPNNGGADCGGICVGGSTTNPCAAALCPAGTICVDRNGRASCEPPGGGTACGGFAGLRCPNGEQCVDDPSDDCDPAHGGADCIGVCVSGSGTACGNTTCPAGQECCNPSCGICVAPGGSCTQQFCK